jgi:hypothetical protein
MQRRRWSWPWFNNKAPEPPVIYPPMSNGVPPGVTLQQLNTRDAPGVVIPGPDSAHTPQPEPPPNQRYGNTANLYPHNPSPIPQSISEPSDLHPPLANNMWAIILIVVVVLLVVIILIAAQYWGG